MKTLFSILMLSVFVAQPVTAQTGTFQVQQNVRNLTQQNFVWANAVGAQPTDRLEMQIIVSWTGSTATENVLVRETLGQGLTYQGNLKLDGVERAENITTETINIGTLQPGQSKTITFEATVQGTEAFATGNTNLVNTSTAFNTEHAASVISNVQVGRDGVPTDVSTGPFTLWMIAGFLLVLVAGVAGVVLYGKYYVRTRVLESTFETRVERKLASTIDKIHKSER